MLLAEHGRLILYRYHARKEVDCRQRDAGE